MVDSTNVTRTIRRLAWTNVTSHHLIWKCWWVTEQTGDPRASQQCKSSSHGVSVNWGQTWSTKIWSAKNQQLSLPDLSHYVPLSYWTYYTCQVPREMMRPVASTAQSMEWNTMCSWNGIGIGIVPLNTMESCVLVLKNLLQFYLSSTLVIPIWLNLNILCAFCGKIVNVFFYC